MNLSQMLIVLRARRRLIFTSWAATTLLALVVSLLWPNIYKATTSLVLNYKGIDPVSGAVMSPQLMPGYVATQVDIIKSKNVAIKVVDQLKLDQRPSFRRDFESADNGRGRIRDWIADSLLKKVRVMPARESSVMEVTYKSTDPQFAADVANAFAEQYLRTVVELNTDPLKNVSAYFSSQIGLLRDNLEKARNRLSKYQQEKGIVSTDNEVDVESARLNELSTQLVEVQGLLMEAQSRQRQSGGRNGKESPDIMADPLIQNLKAMLAESEAKLAFVSQRLQREHPQYLSAEAETKRLRAELDKQIQAKSNSIAANARVYAQRERELREALDAQREKVLLLNRDRDQLSVLAKDVESAQHAFDAATQRLHETNLTGHANLPDVTVLAAAVPPVEPWFPKLPLNLAVAAVFGLILGATIAFLRELSNRRIRSEGDLEEVLNVPVLASFDWTPPRPRAPLAPAIAFQRLITGARRLPQ